MGKGRAFEKHVNFPEKDVELGIPSAPQRTITYKIKEVKVDIKRLRESVEELRALHVEGKECITEAERSEHQRRVQDAARRVNSQAKATIGEVQELRKQNQKVERQVQEALANKDTDTLRALVHNDSTSITRRRERISQMLFELTDIEKDLQDIEDNFKLEKRQMVEAHLQDALDRDVSEDDLDSVMENPEALNRLLRAKMIERKGVVLEETLREVQGRLDTAKQLERDVLVVAQMFMQMKSMLAEQGEQINIIAQDIEEALKEVVTGNKDLAQAVVHVDTRRKTQMWVVMMVVGIIAILVLALVLGFVL